MPSRQATNATCALAENLNPTPILDWQAPVICGIAEDLRNTGSGEEDLLQAAHRRLADSIRPVYTLDELQPASLTILKKRGSCSQRMACLEAVARAVGVPTRARALYIDGQFWAPRFRMFHWFLPKSVLLIWPQFFIRDEWLDVDEIYAPLTDIAVKATGPFRNDRESIFEAISHTPVDFFGKTCAAGCPVSDFSLQRFLRHDNGVFSTRDELLGSFPLLQDSLRGRAFEAIFGGRKSV